MITIRAPGSFFFFPPLVSLLFAQQLLHVFLKVIHPFLVRYGHCNLLIYLLYNLLM
jgi:hypothetical protein